MDHTKLPPMRAAVAAYKAGTALADALIAQAVNVDDFRLYLREFDGLLALYAEAQEARRVAAGDDRLRE